MFEFANFATGTKAVMDAVVQATQGGAVTIIGETVDFIKGFIIILWFCLQRNGWFNFLIN